ncbi:MAG: hypothetical protein IJT79_05240 [Ruminococcus sp.]|nr:hypothetical protein [Ruminococcus sp.]
MDVSNHNYVTNTQITGVAESDADLISAGVPLFAEGDEIIDAGDDFNFDDFQVVRREFFAHLREPAVSFNKCKFYVNSACLKRFPNTDYVQVLINRERKIMALHPCSDSTRDSFAWCSVTKDGKRKPKQTTCKLFFAKIMQMMDWNPDYRYKMLGKMIKANGQYLIAFDLTATEVYQRKAKEGEKPTTVRTPVFPAEWQNQFGLPYNEHKQAMQIDIFNGYAVYSIKESNKTGEVKDGAETVSPATTAEAVTAEV